MWVVVPGIIGARAFYVIEYWDDFQREAFGQALVAAVNRLLLVAYARFSRRDGEVLAMLLTLYPITRFVLEIFRTDEPDVFGTGLTISQTISLILLFGAVLFWAYVLMKPAGTAFGRYQQPNTTH
jgi:prolipoprotein diacylglyceryltransferase